MSLTRLAKFEDTMHVEILTAESFIMHGPARAWLVLQINTNLTISRIFKKKHFRPQSV